MPCTNCVTWWREGDGTGLLRLVGRVEERGRDLTQFARGAIEHFRRIFMVQNTDAEPEFLDLSDEEYEAIKGQADSLDPREVPGYLRILQETAVEMKVSTSPRMILEMGLVRMARPEMELSPRPSRYGWRSWRSDWTTSPMAPPETLAPAPPRAAGGRAGRSRPTRRESSRRAPRPLRSAPVPRRRARAGKQRGPRPRASRGSSISLW